MWLLRTINNLVRIAVLVLFSYWLIFIERPLMPHGRHQIRHERCKDCSYAEGDLSKVLAASMSAGLPIASVPIGDPSYRSGAFVSIWMGSRSR